MDPGRLNYREDDPLGMYGLSARAHNGVLVDGCEPFIYHHRGRYPDFYKRGSVEVRHRCDDESASLAIHHDGFSRLDGDPILFDRSFHLASQRLVIEDRLAGRSRHYIDTYFQWGPGVTLEEGEGGICHIVSGTSSFRATFEAEPHHAEEPGPQSERAVLRGAVAPAVGGWHFPAYGEQTLATTLVFRDRISLPYVRRYVLQWVN